MDYWDRLGWKDPFGSPAGTARQRAYRPRLKMRGLVTPEILVGNEKYAVGWDAKLRSATEEPARVVVSAGLEIAKGRLDVSIRLEMPAKDLPEGAVLLPVLFQRRAVTEVPKGENAGKTLTEFFVVRAVQKPIPAADAFEKPVEVSFVLPKGESSDNLGLAVLVEDPAAMATIEAAVFDLPDDGSRPKTDGLFLVYELDDRRAVRVRDALEPHAKKAGFAVGTITGTISDEKTLTARLDELRKETGYDGKRVVVFGFSSAANGAFDLARRFPGSFAGAVLAAGPVGGGTKGLAKGFPVLLVYGNTDSVAPGSVGRSVGKALKAGRLAVRLEILKETDHKKVLSGACALAPGWAKKLR